MATRQAERKKVVPTERKSRFSTAVDEEAMDFIRAIEDYKAAKGRAFPSWTEVLLIVKSLGYRRVAERTSLPEGPAGVRDDD